MNRAGFALLHPLNGVVGTPMMVRHSDGVWVTSQFPTQISPSQTAVDITGLQHKIRSVDLGFIFIGEVFEMEDQRNWSDASFKTYCRPLSAPKPFILMPGRQWCKQFGCKWGQMGRAHFAEIREKMLPRTFHR